LEREFTRAGFHKPTSTLNFKNICDYLCSSSRSNWIVNKINGQNILIRRLGDQEIEEEYSKLLKQSLLGL